MDCDRDRPDRSWRVGTATNRAPISISLADCGKHAHRFTVHPHCNSTFQPESQRETDTDPISDSQANANTLACSASPDAYHLCQWTANSKPGADRYARCQNLAWRLLRHHRQLCFWTFYRRGTYAQDCGRSRERKLDLEGGDPYNTRDLGD
jgi:hypothetical protein